MKAAIPAFSAFVMLIFLGVGIVLIVMTKDEK